ncbi:hypothetical protein IQ06DRAFT_300601 [Phaeosphaeriaceae sp. SRC1lsM3a]|nr:hypothetical protein IQ06DRAFT_300601 [Stagonospora sp. SRC1lsM3a]
MPVQRDRFGRFKNASRPRERTTQRLQARGQDEGEEKQDQIALLQPPPKPLDVPTPDGEDYSLEDDNVEEHDLLLERVKSGIEYTKSRKAQNLPVLQTTRFSIHLAAKKQKPSEAHTAALSLLRASPATIIYTAKDREVFELGCKNLYMVAEGVGHTSPIGPQWWVDKSAAEIKAGPLAAEEDLRKAHAKIKELETNRRKRVLPTQKQINMDWKLAEGLRRQKEGLEMFAAEDEGQEQAEEDTYEDDGVWNGQEDEGMGSELDVEQQDAYGEGGGWNDQKDDVSFELTVQDEEQY